MALSLSGRMRESMAARWPVQVVTTVVETDAGRYSLSVTATFSLKLQHGRVAIPTEEAPNLEADERVVFDLDAHAPYKPRVDLLISGHACVPEGEDETDRLLVRLRFGDFAKAVRTVGTRVWVSENGGLVVGPARKFRRLRISADRAPKTPENPAGMGTDAVPADGRMAKPNFEPVTPLGAANLGPVPDTATTRAQFAPDGALAWVKSLGLAGKDPKAAAPGPKPPNLNYAFFNAAPHDQQLEKWMEGSAVVLEGLHASHAVFTSRMPSFEVTAEIVTREGDPPSELRLRTDTLWVLADQELVTLRARGLLPLPDARWSGKVDVHVRGRDPIEPAAPPTPDMQHTRAAVDLPLESVLPFQNKLAKDLSRAEMFVTQEMQLGGESPLPFGALPEDTTTHDLPGDVVPSPDTQDGGPPRDAAAHRSALPFKALGEDDSTPNGPGDTIPPAPPPPKAEAKLRPPDLGPTRSPPLPPEEDDAKMRTTPMPALGKSPPPNLAIGGTVAMSHLVIPLADASFDAPTTTADVRLSLRETEELLSAARSAFPLPPSDGFEVDGVTLEHCAVIRAQLNAKPGDRAGILEHHGVSEGAFAKIERTHLRRVDEANQRDEGDLLARYDAAYIAAFESLVRPIDVATYARMAVAKERGDLAAILADLSLPRTEFMRIERVWTRRIAADRLLGEGFQQAVARARAKPQ